MIEYNYIRIEDVRFPPTLAELKVLNQYFVEQDAHRAYHLGAFRATQSESPPKNLVTYCVKNYLSYEMYQWLSNKIRGNYAST